MVPQQNIWTSLEIVKLVVSALTPITVVFIGWYFTRLTKRFEQLQWSNQRLIEKRIAVYDELAPKLNDLLCYFTFVGCWKDLTPPNVVAMKREIDKIIYLAAPLFSEEFYTACNFYLNLCFSTFQGWGRDATLRTPSRRRQEAAGDKWEAEWDDCFNNEDTPDVKDIRRAYKNIMLVLSRDIGLNPGKGKHKLGDYPTNIH